MKNNLIPLIIVCSLGYGLAGLAQFAGYIPFPVFSAPGLVGALALTSLLTLLCSDYSRKPRFRVRRSDRGAAQCLSAKAVSTPAADWTYSV